MQITHYWLVAEDYQVSEYNTAWMLTELAQLSVSHSKGQELAVIEY